MKPKLFIVLIVLIISGGVLVFSEASSDITQVDLTNYNFLKRAVCIFSLSGNINDYNYASQQYQDKVNGKLLEKGLFVPKITEDNVAKDDNLQELCKLEKSDIIIFGDSVIRGKKKVITLRVYDFILKKIILKINITIGSVLRGEIENATDYMALELSKFYSIFNKKYKPFLANKYIVNLIKLSRTGDAISKLIANNILNQKDGEVKYRIIFDSVNEYFPVFFNRNNIIFINTDYLGKQKANLIERFRNRNKIITKTPEEVRKERAEFEKKKEFTVKVNGKIFTTKEKILILSVPPNKYKKLIFTVQKYGKKPRKILMFLNENKKIAIRDISSILNRKMPTRRFYFDFENVFTTMGFVGLGFKFGFAIPQKDSKLDMSIFFDIQVSVKMFLLAEHISLDQMKGPNDIKFLISLGYKKMFYIKNFIGIGIGIKMGIEQYFLRYIKMDGKLITFGNSFPYGYLSFIFSFPIEVEIPSFSKFNFFIGVEPTLRISQKFFNYNGKNWADTFYIDNLDKNYFHININSSDKTLMPDTGIDLFFNDIPIVIGFRLKI